MPNPNRFGFEWERYSAIKPYEQHYRQQFLNWVHPLTPADFKNKTILDAGCGMGRNSYWPLVWGAESVVAFDADERSTTAAQANLASFPNARVEVHDIYHLPWKNTFDLAFSIGVIHHLPDPPAAIQALKQTLKPGGQLLIWVYGRVGYEKILPALQFVRQHITSKLPPTLLHLLTYVVSLPLYAVWQLVPPQRPYFRELAGYRFSHFHSILFDQLLPPIARYYSQAEAHALLAGFREVIITPPPNGNGWIVRGFK